MKKKKKKKGRAQADHVSARDPPGRGPAPYLPEAQPGARG